jgi:serine O-acetyltransferase
VTTPDFDAISAHLSKPYANMTVQGPHRASFPDRGNAAAICDLLLNQLFPGFFNDREATACAAPGGLRGLHTEIEKQIRRSLRFFMHVDGRQEHPDEATIDREGRRLADAVITGLPAVLDLLTSDVEAAFENDPAAFDRGIIILSYPCIEAISIQRFAHLLYALNVPLLPRMLTEVAHSRTGIDIHPGAKIGPSFFIDHGTGVVIGETCTIGAHCVLYQGVTLGAWNPTAKDSDGILQRGAANKRHPDLEDHVTVYPGATILGGSTVIGHHSVIGGKVVLSHSIEPYSVVVVDEPKLSIRKRKTAKS